MRHFFKRLSFAAILLSILFVYGTSDAFAVNGGVRKLFDSTAVNNQDVATSAVIPVKSGGFFGVWYKATSAASTPDIKIEYEMSYDTTAANFVEPAGASDIATNLTGETAVVESVSPPPMAYMRIKATGNAGNAADTVLTLYLFQQEG